MTVELRTPIPGPRSKALMERRQKAVCRGPSNTSPVFIEKAHGATVEDVDGNVLLDFVGAIGCLNVGHTPAGVVDAVREQAGRYLHSCFHTLPHEPYIALAERLNSLVPGDGPRKTLLVNSGAEAVENAVKIARAFTGKPGVLCFEDAFHGRTLFALGLTSKINPTKKGFGPFPGPVHRLPYAYCYRCPAKRAGPPAGAPPEDCEIHHGHHLDSYFRKHVDPETIACAIVEPILGEGGFVVPPADFLHSLRAFCDDHGILLIADEVQTGIGRTGRMFASEHFGLVPDIVLTAKSLAAGVPLAAVVGRQDVMDVAAPGGLGSTYGGNPLACASALAVLDQIEAEGLCERATAIGSVVKDRLCALAEDIPWIGDVRGLGAMCAVEFVRDRQNREPAGDECLAIQRLCYERGLLTMRAGTYGCVLRTLIPLVISDADLDEGVTILESAIRDTHSSWI